MYQGYGAMYVGILRRLYTGLMSSPFMAHSLDQYCVIGKYAGY